ncbi:hypothetical protein HHL19_30360 [Streptomyces sp. R302]|uniref:hypothetical protein n=1 Tax=unclassified Streptomyces TaxID=2593676 RepID=UPI00145E2199|nr:MULTISPECIES: hypothetical protein [unclassified Streptomyces]NML53163.1 hypothetical protein [Streptomyces sp. R301]NML82846.1 hypothetical protein [Streptomyces sp. R302]
MTAEASAQQTPEPASESEPAPAPASAVSALTERERRQASRVTTWSIAWLILALLLWGWFAFLMLADYGPMYGDRAKCRAPLVGPASGDVLCRDALREWPALLGILALAVIASVVGAATRVYAKVLGRLANGDELF